MSDIEHVVSISEKKNTSEGSISENSSTLEFTHTVYAHGIPKEHTSLRERISPMMDRFGKLHLLNHLVKARMEYREYLAEFIGMFILILLGSGISTVFVNQVPTGQFPVDLACLFWGFAIM
ncbi:hypothetical protein BJ684DRAFT_17796, partial [Piptocephalis cylindrospora]